MPTPPEGFLARSLAHVDVAAAFAVYAAQQLADIGTVEIEEADIAADWQRPSFEPSRDAVGVQDAEGRLVAIAEVDHTGRGDAAVHPDVRGRGLGTWLALWMQERGRAHGCAEIGMPVPVDSPGDRLLAELGYRARWTSWVLELPDDAVVPARTPPTGYAVRTAEPDDHAAVHVVVEDAFSEWPMRVRQDFDDFAATTIRRPGFEPWHLRVVTDPGGAVVGVAVLQIWEGPRGREGYLDKLAVRADQRGRGLAQVLMADAFTAAREHGAPRSALSTDSRTGALGLYEKMGMVVASTWVNRGIAT